MLVLKKNSIFPRVNFGCIFSASPRNCSSHFKHNFVFQLKCLGLVINVLMSTGRNCICIVRFHGDVATFRQY